MWTSLPSVAPLATAIRFNCFRRWEAPAYLSRGASSRRGRLFGSMKDRVANTNNRALVADNDRMYHRIGWIGEPAAKIPSISPSAQIEHVSGSGWVISDGDRHV